ncbi:MAG: hypothetical protein K2I42_06535 [Anaeroplasmataceae bacterium]|nr:hypothetical protein [Anaeroplasmataceae bacterium]
MIRLFHSLFYRLKKDKLFYGSLLLFVAVTLFVIIFSYLKDKSINILFHQHMCYISILFPLLVSAYIGVEYADGTIRNKIMIGTERYKIYLTYWIFLLFIGLSMYMLYYLILCSIGIPLLGVPNVSGMTICSWLLSQSLTIIAMISIFTFTSFICSNRLITSIINVFIVFVLLILVVYFLHKFTIPEYIDYYQINTITQETEVIHKLNPNYPSDLERSIYKGLLYILPTSQPFAVLIGIPLNQTILSVVLSMIAIIFTGFGIFIFSRKDLK